MWSGHTVLFNSVFKVSLRHIQLVWLASISIAFMQWKTHWVKQPPALIKAFCPAFYSHHGNYAAAPKHPRQTTKEEADCPPPTHTPFMYHIPWLSLVALLDLLPSFKMINADKNSSMEKNVCLFVFASVWLTDSKTLEELKPPDCRHLLNVAISHKRSKEQRAPYRNTLKRSGKRLDFSLWQLTQSRCELLNSGDEKAAGPRLCNRQ